MVNNFYVYAHVRNDTNTIFYIGKGKDKRAWSKSRTRRNSYWHNVVNKAGYTVVLLKQRLDEVTAFAEEIRLIQVFKAFGHTLTNMTDGGEGASNPNQETREKIAQKLRGRIGPNKGKIMSDEQKERISISKKGQGKGRYVSDKTRKKIGNAHRGKKLSEEHKQILSKMYIGRVAHNKGVPMSDEQKAKLRLASTGRKMSKDNKEKLFQAVRKPILCHQNNTIYPSLTQAAKELNLPQPCITYVLKGKYKHTGNYTFSYITKEELK
jgi:hypothetical protein